MRAMRVRAVIDAVLWIGAGFVALALVPALLLANAAGAVGHRRHTQP